jgi:hypothetical protein
MARLNCGVLVKHYHYSQSWQRFEIHVKCIVPYIKTLPTSSTAPLTTVAPVFDLLKPTGYIMHHQV